MASRPRKSSAAALRTADALQAVGGRTGKVCAADLAEYLGKSEQTLANWRWQRKGPRYVGRGRGLRYDWADVGEWLISQRSDNEDVRRGAA